MNEHNTRADSMWMQIAKHICFANTNVIDFGCGAGDFLWRAAMSGANNVLGFDKDIALAREHRKIHRALTGKGEEVLCTVEVVEIDFDMIDTDVNMTYFPDRENTVAISFSVLPYLKRPEKFLEWLKNNFVMTLLECQYKGDGPGLDYINDEQDMRYWLTSVIGFYDADIIGTTVAKQKFERHIWRCLP